MVEHHIVEIPLDVSRQIVSDLDSQSLRRLARVSKAWQTAAEPTLWRTISFSAKQCPAIGGVEEFVSDDMEDELEDWVLGQYRFLQAALKKQPARALYIQELRVECTASTATILCAILEGTQSSLRQLVVGAATDMGASEHFISRCGDTLRTVLRSFSTMQSFPELRRLSLILVDDQWDAFWSSLLRLVPNLDTLSVDFLDHPLDRMIGASLIPTLPPLVELSVTVTSQTFPIFADLVQRSCTLQRLHLRGRGLSYSLLPDSEVDKLVKCNSLKHVKLDDDGEETNMAWHTMLERKGAFDCVETLVIGFPAFWVSLSPV